MLPGNGKNLHGLRIWNEAISNAKSAAQNARCGQMEHASRKATLTDVTEAVSKSDRTKVRLLLAGRTAHR